MCFETGFESKDRVSIANVLWEKGAERLKALDHMAFKRADGVLSWMAEKDLRVREGV